MAKILAIETATDACSAALLVDGEIDSRFEVAARQHASLILPMVAELLGNAELAVNSLDAIAFGAGPGSFTGVRIATAVAQGLALAHDIPVVPLSCLEILALGGARTHGHETIVPLMDARRQEIYWAVYTVDTTSKLAMNVVQDSLTAPGNFESPTLASWIGVGLGGKIYHEELIAAGVSPAKLKTDPQYPDAIDALQPALWALQANIAVAAEFAQPIYLRRAL